MEAEHTPIGIAPDPVDNPARELSVPEQERLETLEKTIRTNIKRGMRVFYEIGKALEEIRKDGLWRRYPTFEGYCNRYWGFSDTRAHQYLDAAESVDILRPIAKVLPTSEFQLRPMAKLAPEQKIQVWEKVQQTTKRPTASAVRRAIAEVVPVAEPVREQREADIRAVIEDAVISCQKFTTRLFELGDTPLTPEVRQELRPLIRDASDRLRAGLAML